MSAYGALSRQASVHLRLPATAWRDPRDPSTAVTLFHLAPSESTAIPVDTGLFEHLHAVFADEVDRGMTYPQEDMRDPEAFRAYFFAADVIIAVVGPGEQGGGAPAPMASTRGADNLEDGGQVEIDLECARGGRAWDACLVGFYYIKPNYPGRSSHICNAGFIVPPAHRNGGYGRVLARSYLYYAPRLGYRASVFNLVYVNNAASVRLWEQLGFQKAGLIPKAGRLKRADGQGEEYVDAWVFYKSFVVDDDSGHAIR